MTERHPQQLVTVLMNGVGRINVDVAEKTLFPASAVHADRLLSCLKEDPKKVFERMREVEDYVNEKVGENGEWFWIVNATTLHFCEKCSN